MNWLVTGKKAEWYIKQWAIFFACFLTVTVLGVWALQDFDRLILYFGDSDFGLNFRALPFLIFAGLFGEVPVFTSTMLVFLIGVFTHPDYAYLTSIYVLAGILFSRAGRKQVFRKKSRCFWLFLRAIILIGVLNTVLLMLMEYDFNLQILAGTWATILSSVPEVLIAVLFCNLFFNKAPDKVKERVYHGLIYYNRETEEDEIKRKVFFKNILGAKITAIVLAEAIILVISAIGFTTLLLPDLQKMNQKRVEGEQSIDWMEEREYGAYPFDLTQRNKEKKEVSTENELPPDISELTAGISEAVEAALSKGEDMAFAVNDYGLGYMIKFLLMLFCMAIPVAAFADSFTQAGVVVPISQLSSYMVRFARTPQSRLEEYVAEVKKLDIKTRDEIEDLYHAVDRTVHDVIHYINRVEEEQKLKEDLRVAEASSKAKSEFLSNMSHEIRTPINAVLGLDEMILRSSMEKETLRYATDIKNAGNTLLGIINDILDSSKIESGKMEVLPVTYELASMVNDIVNMTRPKADDKGLALEVHVDENIPHLLYGDEIRIKQCILNVLTNAVKYTEKGKVTLTIGYKEQAEEKILLTVRVEDTGIGIKEEDLSKLFSPFERIEEIRNRTIEGTGLGMSIVKHLLALMDTKLEVKSVYGEGSDFYFEVLQGVQDKKAIGNFEESYRLALEEQEQYSALFQAPDAKILVTDDTVMNLTVIRGLLQETLIDVDTAESGPETLEKIKKTKYDVILLDHRMPEMDGIETKQAMETLEGNLNADTPVIALTANAVSGARDMYMEAGFIDYLTKPVDTKKLEKMLLEYIPAEKCHRRGEAGYEEIERKRPELTEDLGVLAECGGMDLKAALKNCGNKDVLLEAAKNFLTVIPERSAEIEDYAAKKDYRNFTVLVHALKSSARLLGATELSERAAALETYGNEENGAAIEEKTPELLALYRSYEEKLSPLKEKNEAEKPLISEDELAEAYAGLKEFVDAFDFDSADRIMEMLSGYEIPDTEVDRYDKIKKCMAAVDRDGVLELL